MTKINTLDQTKAAAAIARRSCDTTRSGRMDEAAAKAAAAAKIGKIRDSEGESIWIHDVSSRMAMHPIKPELNGKAVSGNKDLAGNALCVQTLEGAQTRRSAWVDALGS